MESEMEKYGTPGDGLLCPAERLQMAFRIKSKSVLTARERVRRHIRCHGRVGALDRPQWRWLKSKGSSRRVEIAFKWLFLKHLKINWLSKKKKKKAQQSDNMQAAREKSPSLPFALVWGYPTPLWQIFHTLLVRLNGHQHACRY